MTEEIERNWTVKAAKMTLAEIDNGLVALPVTPKTDNDLIGRAVLARRRGEIVNAARQDPNAPPPDPAGLVEVIVPEGGSGCVQSRTLCNKFYYASEEDGHFVIRMPWADFYGLAFSFSGSGPGPNGGAWLDANPHLVDRLPKNPPPPPPAPPHS